MEGWKVTHCSSVNTLPMKSLVEAKKIIISRAMISSMVTPVNAALLAARGLPAPSSLPTRIATAVP